MKLCKSYKLRKLRDLQITIPQSTDSESFKVLNKPISWDYTQLIRLCLEGHHSFDISLIKQALSMCTNLLFLELIHWHEKEKLSAYDIGLPKLVSLVICESLGFEVIQSCDEGTIDYFNKI